MKKLFATIATGVLLAGVAATGVSAQSYNVQSGDTLWNIAQTHNTTVENLISSNNLGNTTIYPNQSLVIGESATTAPQAQAQAGNYTVASGDTIFKISRQFGVSVQNIKSWNGLSSDLINVGQSLSVNGANRVEVATTQPQQVAAPTEQTNAAPQGNTISVRATAYTAGCAGCSGITATGVNLNNNPNAKVIAVDPSVIPLGSKVYVEGYGYATAADTGGAIKGNKIDIHVPTKSAAYAWGVRTVNVTIVN